MQNKPDNPFSRLPVIGWFPGHMLKAGRQIKQQLNLVDLVVELRDARIPQTARNTAFISDLGGKPRCLVLTKSDLAEAAATRSWVGYLRQKEGIPVFSADAVSGRGIDRLPAVFRALIDQHRRFSGARRGLLRPPRLMIAGIPNVGKSTLINRLAENKQTAVGPRPGLTRSQQWVRLRSGMELLDTPGVLWPRIEDKVKELKLALAGTIKDELIGEELLVDFLVWWASRYQLPLSLGNYGIDNPAGLASDQLLQAVGKRRGLLRAGGLVDQQKAAIVLLHDLRAGRLGRVTFDLPGNHGE